MSHGHTTHGSAVRPMRRGRPPKSQDPAIVPAVMGAPEAPEHVIHEDGTYSNTGSSKKLDLKGIKINDTLIFGRTYPVSVGVAHKIVDAGIYCRPRKDELPDMSRCIFYNWDEIKDLCTEVV